MLERLFSGLSLAEVHGDLYRNIVSLRESEHLFDDLSDNPTDWQAAIEMEIECKPAMFVSPMPIIHRPFEEAAWNEAIGFPFRNWTRSRYSDGTFGVWYGGDTLETTVYETAYHWRHGLLDDAGFTQPGIQIERKACLVRCDSALVDFRASVKQFPALVHPQDYTLTNQVGARLHREGHPGLVSRSARCGGDMFAILNPDVLSNPRQNCFLTYTTTENGIIVERIPGKVWLTIEHKQPFPLKCRTRAQVVKIRCARTAFSPPRRKNLNNHSSSRARRLAIGEQPIHPDFAHDFDEFL